MSYYDPDDDKFDFFPEDAWEEGVLFDRVFSGILLVILVCASLFMLSYL